MSKKRSRQGKSCFKDNYKGYTLSPSDMIRIIAAEDITSEEFYESFVSKRRPVVLRSSNSEFLREAFSYDSLINIAGNEMVQVEDKRDGNFGSSNVEDRGSVKFSTFMRSLKTGRFYMTTQDIKDDEEKGIPSDFCPLIVRRFVDAGLIPEALPVAGNLLLDQINCWMGYSNSTTSSGFHHDFHDNLYFVIKGKKLFKLCSPDKISLNRTCGSEAGNSVIIHPNGFVSYSGDLYREDGASKVDVLSWKAIDSEEASDELEEFLLDRALETEVPESKKPPSFCIERSAPIDSVNVELVAGDIFYLPAGYLHEVLSSNDKEDTGHMVFNYWYHPPCMTGNYENPYPDDFWKVHSEKIGKVIDKRRRNSERQLLEYTRRKSTRVSWRLKPRPLCRFFKTAEIKRFLLGRIRSKHNSKNNR